ncbi:endonuclease/exonuclease/phosphatase family protein [Pseudomonas baltica]|uniref:endonuclease/exonuclease/phosphatase family protein n=1 Tax=Pseudomonas baltica TaxID=2762576 RepID=UPI00289CFDAB|nr:endonuclease/exonuclease/phosphatase family protein [Pseudomonas baltica]
MKKIFLAALMLLTLSAQAFADVRIGTWNLEHLSVRPNKDIPSIAKVAQHVDFLAVQEVMSEEGLLALKNALEQVTHEKWSMLASDASGRSSYKEMYGFVWRDSAVTYLDGATTYIDRRDLFAREPFSARFKSTADKSAFVAATVHIVYGKSTKDRSKEITALGDYWDWLGQTYTKKPAILLMGDFNTKPISPAWADIRTRASPLVTDGASTLSVKDGKFANLYDNIIVANDSPIKVKSTQIFNYPAFLGMTHEKARKTVSDHAPIFMQAQFTNTLAVGKN